MNNAPRLDQDIAAADSRVPVLVIRADEDWEIACECRRLLPDAVPAPKPEVPTGS